MQQQRGAAADERISWWPRGDGVQRCSLEIQNYARGSAGHSKLGVAESTKAVWLDLRLASLLTHLFNFIIALLEIYC